ncbi:MAG TPA: GerMN domain-containing protein [Spirochaetota bacterium]|nr:GerMN domain-containing protein [Spirochaetota bacterium]
MAENGSSKKKTPAPKKAPKKKAPAKKAAAPKKAAPRSAAGSSAGSPRSRGPAYILIIMVLLTVIVLLAYRLYRTSVPGGSSVSIFPGKHITERRQRVAAVTRHDVQNKREIRKQGAPENKKDIPDRENNTAAAMEKLVRIYFLRVDENSGHTSLVPVTRKVSGEDLLNESLQTLIKGPTRSEENRGLLSAVPGGLRLRSVRTRGSMALLDFNSAIEHGATGSILISRIDQIVYTATQFPNITSVVITINGTRKHFIGSDGLSINGPLHRRN